MLLCADFIQKSVYMEDISREHRTWSRANTLIGQRNMASMYAAVMMAFLLGRTDTHFVISIGVLKGDTDTLAKTTPEVAYMLFSLEHHWVRFQDCSFKALEWRAEFKQCRKMYKTRSSANGHSYLENCQERCSFDCWDHEYYFGVTWVLTGEKPYSRPSPSLACFYDSDHAARWWEMPRMHPTMSSDAWSSGRCIDQELQMDLSSLGCSSERNISEPFLTLTLDHGIKTHLEFGGCFQASDIPLTTSQIWAISYFITLFASTTSTRVLCFLKSHLKLLKYEGREQQAEWRLPEGADR